MSGRPMIGPGAIVTACSILEGLRTNAELEKMILEYGLCEVSARGSISKTAHALREFAVANPERLVTTDFGESPLPDALIRAAIERVGWTPRNAPLWDKLERYLNLNGYALLKEQVQNGWLTEKRISGIAVAMPEMAELPESASEVEALLKRHSFKVAERHMSSAQDNIAQGDWEAANAQCRTFLEALTDAIADALYPEESPARNGGIQKRQLLADRGFLSREKHEFGDGNGQSFLPGLAKLLHPDGAHPGISTQHDAMFRLQVVIVTARWLLKRYDNFRQ